METKTIPNIPYYVGLHIARCLNRMCNKYGYNIETIHGGKSVDERRIAQNTFAKESQILIATDAAGEGINLQFCRLLINWDIPWNPNRLEQRMGRIHRYGQKKEVLVFNMVAQNTREGIVLEKLLSKMDLIREQMGDDRVYDVISDIFENVDLNEIINSTFNGVYTKYEETIDTEFNIDNVKEKINKQREEIGSTIVDYQDAKHLKESSDEKRLQPIYIRMFFESAFKKLGGEFIEIRKSIFKMHTIPKGVQEYLKANYNISVDINNILFCFDKQIFLDYQNTKELGTVFYINPGNPLFDSVVNIVRAEYKEEMLKGTILISPDDKEDYFAFFVKTQVKDNRPHKEGESIADERLILVTTTKDNQFKTTSPAKLIDLHSPKEFEKEVSLPENLNSKNIVDWSFNNITTQQFKETKEHIMIDMGIRKTYLEEAFTSIILDLSAEINQLQAKILLGDDKVQDKIKRKQQQIDTLKIKKVERLRKLELMQEVSMKLPQVLGCAYVIPLSQIEYQSHYGMTRDDDVEQIAMNFVMKHEKDNNRLPDDVSKDNVGFDIRSIDSFGMKRYIEVKGRATTGGVMLSENEMNRLTQLGNSAWLYIVTDCKNKPELYKIQNPGKNLNVQIITKGIQYFIPKEMWEARISK